MRNGGPERLRNLPKVTQLRIETPVFPTIWAFLRGQGTSALIEKIERPLAGVTQ